MNLSSATMNRIRAAALCVAMLLLVFLLVSLPAAAGPRNTEMRWAHSWDEAIEEAWLRECVMFVHLHDDSKPDSQAMYGLYQDGTVCKRFYEWVNVPVVITSQKHPWASMKDKNGEYCVSKVFNGMRDDEMSALLSEFAARRNTDNVMNRRPAMACYRDNGSLKKASADDMTTSTKLVSFVMECTEVPGGGGGGGGNWSKTVSVEFFLNFTQDRATVHKHLDNKNWSAAIQLSRKMRSYHVNYPRFLEKIDDIDDTINVAGLGLIDEAMNQADLTDRRRALQVVVKSFPGFDAGDRAAELLARYK